ncbi:MAG: HAMP domain-containing protein [Phormidesmis sp. CAN_BIN36]|nr:HAMP domain-containing protein [Phormidesmis sp. CAN_BIN36]
MKIGRGRTPTLNRSVSLSLVLIAPFVLQTFAAVSLVGYLSFRNGQHAVNNLAQQLQQEVSARVDQHLNSYLALPHQINEINLDAIDRGLLNPRDIESAGRYFWKQFQVFKQFSYVGYSLSDKTGAGAGRWIKGQDVLITQHPTGQPDDYNYATDDRGNRTKLVDQSKYDAVTDVWYTETAKAGKSIWSRIYIAGSYDGYIVSSANAPIYDKNRKLLGVLSIDLLLSDNSAALRKIKVSESGQVFILERDGRLIASSGNQSILFKTNNQTDRFSVFNTPDPLMRAIAQALQKRFGDFKSISEQQNLEIQFNGQSQLVHVKPWRDDYGLDWLVVVTVPESDFIGQINANTRTTILLCLAALGVATILGVYTARWIAQPILRLGNASQAIANGDFNPRVAHSPISELNTLALSFNQMSGQLQSSFLALAQTNAELEDRVEARTQDLQQALHDLSRTQAQMIQSEKMSALGQMVAGVSHEINNPVNFIHANLSHLEQYSEEILSLIQLYHHHFPNPPNEIQTRRDEIDLEFLEQDLTQMVRSMNVGTERIREIVLSLRNFSRLDQSDRKAVNLHEGIDSTLLILQHRFKATSDRPEILVIKKYEPLPQVQCYPGQLNQAVMNILANAIDALEERDATRTQAEIAQNPSQIKIHTSMSEQSVKIAIADNGLGMSTQVKQQIFNPFFTTKPVGKGTGMGMSISYQIITEKHGGTLECFSTPEQGTEFVIQIPLTCPIG